jgi:hypothetical protein
VELTVLCILVRLLVVQANIFGPLLKIRLAHTGKEIGPHLGPSPMRATDSKGNKVAEGKQSSEASDVIVLSVISQFPRLLLPRNRHQYIQSACIGSCLHAFTRGNAVGAVQEQHATTAEPDSAQRVHAGQCQCAQQLARATVSHTHEQEILHPPPVLIRVVRFRVSVVFMGRSRRGGC